MDNQENYSENTIPVKLNSKDEFFTNNFKTRFFEETYQWLIKTYGVRSKFPTQTKTRLYNAKFINNSGFIDYYKRDNDLTFTLKTIEFSPDFNKSENAYVDLTFTISLLV